MKVRHPFSQVGIPCSRLAHRDAAEATGCRLRNVPASRGLSVTTAAALAAGLLLAVPAPAVAAAISGKPARPSVLLLLADDLGYADLSCYGATDIRTPHLDRLAREGVRFTQFYSNGQECSPTRTALLTGRYQQRVGGLECAIGTGNVGRYDDAIRLAARGELGLPPSETSLARMLREVGYATAVSGKWHLGYPEKFGPNHHGFDHAFYALGGGMDYFHHVEDPPAGQHVLRLNGLPEKRRGYATDLFAAEAEQWLRQHAARAPHQPFFLYLPFTAPHAPFQGPGEEQPAPLPADSPRWNQGRAPPEVYAAMIERMDAATGRLLALLEELRLARTTMVIFMSDNGGTRSARPFGLREYKGTTFEGGIRVPALVRWPGVLPAGATVSRPALTFDVTASIARAAGVVVPPSRALDGIDILGPIARGETLPSRDLFWRGRRGERTWRSARERDLKLVVRADGAKREEHLFDLAADPAEQHNLLAARPADAARLRAKLAAWEDQVRPVR
ncbi:MAG: sulfatase-like hydrolase/transferase [Verrucomicrobia bacterium]|nr:sulfatase-like hydrolase/transferase [Verrucomicrobiota bacterium]